MCNLANSSYQSLDKSGFQKGVINVIWHLQVKVNMNGQPVESANVQSYYSSNGSVAAQQTTPSNGTVQFDLPQWQITELGNINLEDYKVNASYGTSYAESIVTLSSSKEITLQLPQSQSTPSPSVPEFPSWIFLPLFLGATILTAAFVKKKTTKK